MPPGHDFKKQSSLVYEAVTQLTTASRSNFEKGFCDHYFSAAYISVVSQVGKVYTQAPTLQQMRNEYRGVPWYPRSHHHCSSVRSLHS